MTDTLSRLRHAVSAIEAGQELGSEFLKSLVCEALEALEAEGWRPIETAPKDGTNILVWSGGHEIVRYEKYDADIAEETGEEGYWRYSDDLIADVASFEINEAKAWKPLPASPNESSSNA